MFRGLSLFENISDPFSWQIGNSTLRRAAPRVARPILRRAATQLSAHVNVSED